MTVDKVVDHFEGGPSPYWTRVAIGFSSLACKGGQLSFTVENAAHTQLSNAEIGDYRDRARANLPWRPPLRLSARARFSRGAKELRGTSGFGFWNNPFDLLGGGVAAPPNVVWFFCASSASGMESAPGLPGNGFRAEMLNSGSLPGWMMALGNRLLQLSGLTPLLYRAAQTRVNAGAVRLDDVEMTGWHQYGLLWGRSEVVYRVDGREVLRVPDPPSMPLGFVAWMDNQFAVARPDGAFHFGLEEVPGRQWLELDTVEIEPL